MNKRGALIAYLFWIVMGIIIGVGLSLNFLCN